MYELSDNVAHIDYSALSPAQRRALDALLSGGDKDQAAAAAGVTRRTIDRYLNDPRFRAALDRATGAAVGDVARRMIGGMETAVSIMLELATDTSTPASVRLRAAIALVEHGPKLFEQVELIRRLEVLEGRLL